MDTKDTKDKVSTAQGTEPLCPSCPLCLLSVGTMKTFEDGSQPLRGIGDRLGQHARFANHGNEARVAGPPRDEMDVHVIDYARAGGTAEVDADVDTLGLVRLRQRH